LPPQVLNGILIVAVCLGVMCAVLFAALFLTGGKSARPG